MDPIHLCPNCQQPLASNAPLGLCPGCLIQAGFPTGAETDTGSAKQPALVPPTVEEIARLFPQLEILGLIGKGGMGAIYKARQRQLNRVVALKIVPPGIGNEPAFAERFTREAQALAQLNHPNIVTLYEFGETSGQFYFLMEFVDGVNLRQLLAGSRVAPREALAIVPQICDALQFAHDQGIVHRDIKPENILLDRRGRVKVADFGLAKIVGLGPGRASPSGAEASGSSAASDVAAPATGGLPDLTQSGKIMGTPNYMAPEQAEHPGAVDHRADIYALGVVFYQMLTGELPGKRIEPPSKKVLVDVRLDEVVLRALERQPELRYQRVSEVKTMLETIVGVTSGPAGSPAQSQPSTQTMTTNTLKSFWRWAVGSLGVAACVVLAVFALRVILKTQVILGPLDSDASSAGASWHPDWKGGGSTSVDFNDPAAKGGCDFVLNNTNAGADNWACWRCPLFSVGPAANGARPITLSFAYKLDDPVAAKNLLRVQLRFCRDTFWDAAGTNFMGERNVRVGAWTGDSAMTRYRTVTVGNIIAPRNAQTIDIGIWANTSPDEPWTSGAGRFDNFSVTTTAHSLLVRSCVGTAALMALCALIVLLVLFWHRTAPALPSSPMAPPDQSQSSTQTRNTNVIKSCWRGAVMFAGVATCVMLAVFALRVALKTQIALGPPDSDASSAGANWHPDWKGEGSPSVDFNDPAAKGGCDFVLSNTAAGADNWASWRCPVFPLGPATGGARPVTFSFAYKLDGPVAAGNDARVHLRFWDDAGTNFMGERVILVGAHTGDSAMTGYRTITITGIKAPPKARTAEVCVNANVFGPWVSGTARFDSFSVTTAPHSLLAKAGIVAADLIAICALSILLVRFWQRSAPVTSVIRSA